MNKKLGIYFLKMIGLCLIFNMANAADTIGTVASNITSTFGSVTKLLTATAYVGGVMFFAVAIFQFKAHKENPTQIPLSKPMVTLAMATALIFLPTITNIASGTFFGSKGSTAGPSGVILQ